jgi:cytochrome c biogenesis protein
MSATKSNAGREGQAPPSPNFFDQVYEFLSSVTLAISLLGFIAVASIFGTLVKQQASPEEYLSFYSESTYTIIRFLRLDDVFHSGWFRCAVLLFVLNLIFCSIKRFSRLIKSRRAIKIPSEKTLAAMSLNCLAEGKKIDEIAGVFKRYATTQNNEGSRLLERGSLGPYAVYMVHLSIIVILLGGLIGDLFGYKGPLTLTKGETKNSVNVRGRPGESRAFGFALKLTDFKVSFYPSGEPKDYVSNVEVIDNGKSVLQKNIRVNDPLSYRGVNIYQSSYGSNPIFIFDVGGERVELGQGGVYKKDKLHLLAMRYEKSVHNFGPGVQVAYVEQNGQPQTTWFLKDVPRLREKDILGTTVRLDEIKDEYYTGLEVSRDPGVWVVWFGFALILFGLYVNFFLYHRRIYLLQISQGVLVAGTSIKNKEGFREEFEKLKGKLGCS